jgi:hypothetical protein
MGAPWPGVRLTRGASPELREDLVDRRRLGNERDERIGTSIEVGEVQALVPCLERTGERASARLPPRRCASRAVRSAVRTGDPGPAGPRDRSGETAAHAGGPRVVAGPRGRTQVTRGASAERRRSVGGTAWGACRAPARGGPRRWGAPWRGVRLTGGAGPEVGEDLVDHRRLGDAGDDAYRAVAGRARQRVHLKDLLEERRPTAAGLGRRESGRGDHGGWPVRGGGCRLVPHATGAVGIPAIVPRGDVALVGDVHQHPGQELERVGGFGARRRALGLVRPVRQRS